MPKIKPKRMSFVIDMTPLVDITFLLLTFFMFTAKFKSEAESEQKFVIERPKSSADTSKLPDQNLATIKIAIDSVSQDTSYYYTLTNEADRLRVFPDSMKMKLMLKVDANMLDNVIRQTRVSNYKTRFAIDADRKISYKYVEDCMAILQKNNATIFNFVTDKRHKRQ